MTAPLGRIRQAALNPAQLARKVIRNPRLFQEVAEGLKTDKPRVKYGCAKALRLISEQRPDLLYPHFDFFAGLLDHENKILQWDAAFVLSHLARVDDDDKFPAIFARYFSAIPGPGLITAATAIQGGARIAQAKPHLADRIAAEVLKVARARYRTPECRNVAIGHAIHALGDLLPLLRHPAPVIQFVRRQTRNPRPVTRKKAEHFLKAYPGKAASNRTANRRQHMANGRLRSIAPVNCCAKRSECIQVAGAAVGGGMVRKREQARRTPNASRSSVVALPRHASAVRRIVPG